MRSAVSTTTIYQIVLAFTLLFAGFISVAIMYNRAIRLKNESVKIIEKYEGLNHSAIDVLNNYLKSNGYSTKSKCDDGEYGAKSLGYNDFELADNKTDYYYCISFYCASGVCSSAGDDKVYYTVKLFFKFSLPIIGDLTVFKIKGETRGINLYVPNQIWKNSWYA